MIGPLILVWSQWFSLFRTEQHTVAKLCESCQSELQSLRVVPSTWYCAGENQSEFNTLFPGDTGNVTLELYNLGASRNFTIEVTSDTVTSFNFSATPERVFVAENETTMILIIVVAPRSATDGTGIMLTATTSSDEGERDFVSVDVTVSTIPPPEFTENVSLLKIIVSRTLNPLCHYFMCSYY